METISRYVQANVIVAEVLNYSMLCRAPLGIQAGLDDMLFHGKLNWYRQHS
jgi:hypothetical protein